MSKTKKIILISVLSVFIIIATLVMALFIPRTGSKRIDVWAMSDEFDISTVQSIEKPADRDFKLLVLADLQLWTNVSDNNKVFDLVDKLVAETQPDMIATVGDNVSGLATDRLVRQLIKKMESYKIPWAPVFGNHDYEIGGNATLAWQGDKFEDAEYCLFKRGPSNLYGEGNYVVNITENGKILQSLYFFDNGRYLDYGKGDDEIYMGYEQIAWYEWNVKGMNATAGYTVPSMTFTHFAPPEFATAIETLCPKPANDGDYYIVPEEYGFGYCKYIPGTAPKNSGFIDKAKELGSLKYVFTGHDHENNASIDFEGIRYTYVLKTGCSPRPWNDAYEYGGTMVTIGDSVSVSHKVMQTLK